MIVSPCRVNREIARPRGEICRGKFLELHFRTGSEEVNFEVSPKLRRRGDGKVCLVFVLATVILAVPPFTLSRGVFVGGFTSDGKKILLPAPTGERWVSDEQVQRELLFRGWTPPLTNDQMAELAKGLEADFSADVLVAPLKTGERREALVVMRVVSAPLGEIVHMVQTKVKIEDPEDLPQVLEQIFPNLLAKLPLQIPFATVQLCEGGKRVHLGTTGGEWRRGMTLLFLRTGEKVTVLGKGRVVSTEQIIGGNRWMLEANLTDPGIPIRPGDKAVRIFNLPDPLSKWQ